jgi:hypothetical protein
MIFLIAYLASIFLTVFLFLPLINAKTTVLEDEFNLRMAVIFAIIFGPLVPVVIFFIWLLTEWVVPASKALFNFSTELFTSKPEVKVDPQIDAAKSDYRTTKFVE